MGAVTDDDTAAGEGHGDLEYDLAPWAGETRGLLAGLLEGAGVGHVWQGTTLVVRTADEDAVDALVDEVLATTRPAIPADVDRVAFAVGGWPPSLQTELADALTGRGVAYEWDAEGDLVVAEEHAELVDELLEALPDPDEGADELSLDGVGDGHTDGLAVHALLDRLFLATDKLARHPTDATATLTVVEVVADLEATGTPFGFDLREWRQLVDPAVALRDALAHEGPDEEVRAAAGDLRERIRAYI